MRILFEMKNICYAEDTLGGQSEGDSVRGSLHDRHGALQQVGRSVCDHPRAHRGRNILHHVRNGGCGGSIQPTICRPKLHKELIHFGVLHIFWTGKWKKKCYSERQN